MGGSGRKSWLRVAVAGLALVCGTVATGCWLGRPEGPSMLLIVVDTLRADHLGVYGYRHPTSPRLDQFARGAVVFEAASATAPMTMPAMASIFTGLYPDRHGVTSHSREDSLSWTPSATLAELARDAGYRTSAIVTNPWLAQDATAFSRGFQTWQTRGPDNVSGRAFSARQVADAAIEQLDATAGDPFLMWVHFLDPHMPYEPAPEEAARFGAPSGSSAIVEDFRRDDAVRQEIYFRAPYPPDTIETTRALYDAEIRTVDSEIGRVLDHLQELGLERDTVVVIASDHGESLGDHGLYFAHDFTLYEELIHAVLMVRRPGSLPARIGNEVSMVDLLPSACEWMQLRCPEGLDGRPLSLQVRRDPHPRTVYAVGPPWRRRYDLSPQIQVRGFKGRWRMARSQGRKVLAIPTPQGLRWEAYDLERDPHELRDLGSDASAGLLGTQRATARKVDERPLAFQPMMTELAADLERWAAASESTPLAREPHEVDPEMRNALRELGYAD
jgi:arylsulfatase A-like enzyme